MNGGGPESITSDINAQNPQYIIGAFGIMKRNEKRSAVQPELLQYRTSANERDVQFSFGRHFESTKNIYTTAAVNLSKGVMRPSSALLTSSSGTNKPRAASAGRVRIHHGMKSPSRNRFASLQGADVPIMSMNHFPKASAANEIRKSGTSKGGIVVLGV